MPEVLPDEIRNVFSRSKCLFSKPEVETALDQMAQKMNHSLADKNPIFLCVVIGGIVPMGSLLPRLDFPLEVDYIHATRYRNTTTGREVTWKVKPQAALKNRTVVIVDDILDGGITMAEIVQYCREQAPREILTAVLVEKNNSRINGGLPNADFHGLRVDNHYVFGYGMDYKGYLRNAPGIYRV
ncbi:MAG: hypoxanthine-guanine phosphoribosyltransferase [Gammaproteobacteria bacterium RIFCSPHIGHO2_12_FULL_42_13]|nr:MAG: hypoxanthine-guanine phosphoribosyltransferase [Gammaproteobacteria bacterium RIFCSPHIGHO2_12_FULL_42_13]